MSRASWTESAQHDLASLDDGKRPVDVADRIGRAGLTAARFLADNPFAGPMLASGLRKWRLRGTYFMLVYRPTSRGVEIIRFLDARSDWQATLD